MPKVTTLKRTYEGKEIYTCPAIGGRINFNPASISLCHGFNIGDQIIKEGIDDRITSELYIKYIINIIEENQKLNPPCSGCLLLKKQKFEFKGISFLTICTSEYCNSRCVFCTSHTRNEVSSYSAVPFIRDFIGAGLINPGCLFDYGGGEPTINRYFEETFDFLRDKNYRQRVNTNSIQYSEYIADALRNRLCSIRTSVDAGTKETYARVKGVDKFDQVWDSLRKYRIAGTDIIAKYIIFNYNSSKADVNGFIDRCIENGIQTINIDTEYNSYATLKSNGRWPLSFNDNELYMAHYFEDQARRRGLDVVVGAAWATRDAEGKCRIPISNPIRQPSTTININCNPHADDTPIKLHQDAMFLLKNGRLSEAIETIHYAIGMSPSNPEFYKDLGVMYRTSGDGAKAQRYLERALEINPSDAAALKNLAEILIERNQKNLSPESLFADDPDIWKHPGKFFEEKMIKASGNRTESSCKDLRLIAFYLPQYHPIPENDKWWGKGFTEWTNVARAKPLFHGHYQPHLPADLGFYDLRLSETREAQAELARHYGISGFCYYHYWFNGKRLLNKIFDEVMITGKPDFPFCLCWANENWTRVWDGGDKEILMEQQYSHEDDLAHIAWFIEAFKDPRYIKVDGSPLLLIYRSRNLPDPAQTAAIWREEVKKAGFPDIYLCSVESFVDEQKDPRHIGFSASVEFQPDWSNLGKESNQHSDVHVFEYSDIVGNMMLKAQPPYTRLPCVTPSWDNSPRRGRDGCILHNSQPVYYEKWLRHAVSNAGKNSLDERIVFINAWNEWGEGNHLEPDQRHGHAYLHATKRALTVGTEEAKLIDALTEKATAALEQGHLAEAEQVLAEALDYDPLAPQLQHQCAILLFQQGRSHEAIETMNRALSMEPGNAEFNNDIGAMYHAAGDLAKTQRHFEKALEINPEDVTSLKNLTEIFIEKEQFGDARDICSRVITLAPSDEETARLWTMIEDKLRLDHPKDSMAFNDPESGQNPEQPPSDALQSKTEIRLEAPGQLEKPGRQSSTVALVMCPVWNVDQPPLATAYIAGTLKAAGYDVTCHDLSIEFYQSLSEENKKIIGQNYLTPEWFGKFDYWREKLSIDEKADEWAKRILADQPGVVGFSVYDSTLSTSILLAKVIKQYAPSTIIIFGGPSCMDEKLMLKGPIDFMVHGEGEKTIIDLLETIQNKTPMDHCHGISYLHDGKILRTEDQELIRDINTIPFPSFDGFNLSIYPSKMLPMFTSRGCPGHCTFCAERPQWKRYRFRSAQNIFAEMERNVRAYGIRHFSMEDSLIDGSFKEFETMCDLIIKSGLRVTWGGKARIHSKMDAVFTKKLFMAGCSGLVFGIESASQDVLDHMGKGIIVSEIEAVIRNCHNAGINVGCFFITGYINESEKDFQETLDFIKRNHRFIDNVFPGSGVFIMKGSLLHDHHEKYGIILDEHSPDGHWRTIDGLNTIAIRKLRLDRFNKLITQLYSDPKTSRDSDKIKRSPDADSFPDGPPTLVRPEKKNSPAKKTDPSCMISIILSVKNNLKGTSLSIQSILENIQDQSVELIVVDNGSHDGTRDYLNQLRHRKITVILSETESTSAQGGVLGAEKASGAFLMFLDDTVIIIKSWLQNIMKALENTSGWDALVGKTVTEDKLIIEAGSTAISDAGLKSRGAGIHFLDPAYNFTCIVESGSRYGLLIRRDVWDNVKAFNPELEDISAALIDLGLKITSMGYRIVYQPHCILLANNMAIRQPVITNELSPSPDTLVSLRPPDLTARIMPIDNKTEPKNILVLGIYLANSLNTVTDIISVFSGSKLHAVTQKWVALNGQPPDAKAAAVTVKHLNGRVPKFRIINELLHKEDLFHYDYIILCDDDVVLPERFVDSFITMQSRLGFAIAQPARTLNSYIDHPIVARHIGVHARETHFVEIGPVVSFHRATYDFVFPFDLISPMGWGYENVWAHEAIRRNLKMGIIDAVCVDHSLRKPVANYEWNQADKERTAYLEKNVHLPLEECFRVVSAHIMPTESI